MANFCLYDEIIGEDGEVIYIEREPTPEEIASIEADENSVVIFSIDDIEEILAEHEYRICLMELGVNLNDL